MLGCLRVRRWWYFQEMNIYVTVQDGCQTPSKHRGSPQKRRQPFNFILDQWITFRRRLWSFSKNACCLENVFLRTILGGGFKYFLLSPLPGEMIQFDQYCSNELNPPTRIVFTTWDDTNPASSRHLSLGLVWWNFGLFLDHLIWCCQALYPLYPIMMYQ